MYMEIKLEHSMNIGKKHFDELPEYDDTIPYDWNQIDNIVTDIADRIKRRQVKFDNIIGLSRGGLIPGVMLSHKLNVNFVPIVWQTRDGTIKDKVTLSKYNDGANLIVDDLIDSGETYFQIKKYAPMAKYCALFNKQYTIMLDYWGTTLYNEHRWLDFPWEKQ